MCTLITVNLHFKLLASCSAILVADTEHQSMTCDCADDPEAWATSDPPSGIAHGVCTTRCMAFGSLSRRDRTAAAGDR